MRPLTQLLYGLCRIALLALTVAFASFWALTTGKAEIVTPITEYATRYVPIVLLPVSAAMVVVLLLRWMAKNKGEAVGFSDFFAFLLAVALQAATIIVYRNQGHEIAGSIALNIPDLKQLTEAARPYGMLGVTVLQLGAFVCYWVADPDPKSSDD